jgi:hypothetical protein
LNTNEIETRLENLRQAHAAQVQTKAKLQNDLAITDSNLLKIEGAYEALASYKSFTEQPVDAPEGTEGDETSSEVPEVIN